MNLNRSVQGKYGNYVFNANDAFIGKSLAAYGEWAEDELQLLKPYLKRGQTVVDIGANIGTHTLGFAAFVGTSGRVLAFEPQRLIFQCLCATLALNDLANVWAWQMGVSDHTGTMRVPQMDYGSNGNFGGIALDDGDTGEQVPIVRLDEYNLTDCALIKIDVEGMELAVLKGAHETISSHQPVLYVEDNNDATSDELISHIEGLGYQGYWHFSRFYNPLNFFGNQVNIFESEIFDANLLCLRNTHAPYKHLMPAADARTPQQAFHRLMGRE